jgi:CubicO group peptidase (beta-lactamase class C family)
MWKKLFLVVLCVPLLVFRADAQLPPAGVSAAPPAAAPAVLTDAFAGQDQQFAEAFQALRKWIGERAFPGAVLAVGKDGRLLALRSFGRMTYDENDAPMPANAMFDLASCSKVVGCTTAAAILYDRKELDLDAPVLRYLPEFGGTPGHEKILVRHLLLHSSGLNSTGVLWKQAQDRAGILKLLFVMPTVWNPGERAQYRDYNMMLMGEIIQRISGQPLDRFLASNAFGPLGMDDTMYNPPVALIARIPPTEQDNVLRHKLVQGVVHDENAFLMGGVSGHAGLFSTARDLSRFAQMYLNGGIYNGKRILSAATIKLFMERQSIPPGTTRALGWDTAAQGDRSYTPSNFTGELGSPRAIIHTGFTGTSIYIDPDRDAFIILLTNRVYPTRNNDLISKARPEIHTDILKVLDREPAIPDGRASQRSVGRKDEAHVRNR